MTTLRTRATGDIVDAVRAALPGVDVRLGYVDVRVPKVVDAVAGLDGAVVVPAFLASGYHVRTDLPAQLAACGVTPERFRVTPAVGPDPLLARAARARLAEAGWTYGDAVVLAAAGSSDAAALAEVRARRADARGGGRTQGAGRVRRNGRAPRGRGRRRAARGR